MKEFLEQKKKEYGEFVNNDSPLTWQWIKSSLIEAMALDKSGFIANQFDRIIEQDKEINGLKDELESLKNKNIKIK
jgi:hypothetical protein